jgi:hypothetical protein
MFAGKAGAYPSEARFRSSNLGKEMTVSNALPYLDAVLISAVKEYEQGPVL